MPQTASAKKRLRQNIKSRQQNQAARSRLATLRRKFREAIADGDLSKAAEALRLAQKAYDQAGAKGIVHKNNAARNIARMYQALDAAKAPKA